MIKVEVDKMITNIVLYKLTISLIYIIVTFIFTKAINLILSKLEKKFINTDYTSNLALLSTVKTPLSLFLWITCFYQILILNSINLSFIFEVRIILFFAIIAWSFFRFISQYVKIYIEKKQNRKESVDYDGINFVKKLAQIFTFLICVIFCLGKLGISVQSLVAISGAGSLILGLAAREMLSNVFGGLMIYLDKPFAVGDFITSPDRNIEGEIEEIGWRRTRILTFSKYPIYVANSIFTDIIIENRARMKSRNIDEIIHIRYTDFAKIDKITKEIKEMLKNHPNINHRLITMVCFDTISSFSSINLKIYTFTNTVELLRHIEIKQDVLIKIVEIIKNNGAELSYNVQEVIFKKEKIPVLINTEDTNIS